MKAKVLFLPDANASFVSYMKRQKALCRYRSAKPPNNITVAIAATDGSVHKRNDGLMNIPRLDEEVSAEQTDPAAESNR